MTLTKLSLFSGIGGDDLASEWVGIKTICFVEKDKFCQEVLHKHWPNIPIIEDVKDVTRETITEIISNSQSKRIFGINGNDTETEREDRQRSSKLDRFCSGVDIISGGFPCQPHSVAGKRKGSSDERNLWPEFRRVIGEIKPGWVVAENVPGLFSSDSRRFFGGILADLASLGYSIGWCTYGANDVGALHKRDRVFIVAYADTGFSCEQARELQTRENPLNKGSITMGYSYQSGLPDWAGGERGHPSPLTEFERPDGEGKEREIEHNFRRVAHGIPRRVDRLKSLGNAVVPQQIYPIYRAITDIEANR